jgi:putative transposase
LTQLKNRGLQDIFIGYVDGLKGFPQAIAQAIEAVYPQSTVQLCLVHLVRSSWPYVNWKERRPVAQDL